MNDLILVKKDVLQDVTSNLRTCLGEMDRYQHRFSLDDGDIAAMRAHLEAAEQQLARPTASLTVSIDLAIGRPAEKQPRLSLKQLRQEGWLIPKIWHSSKSGKKHSR
jgi:hypothetical protein